MDSSIATLHAVSAACGADTTVLRKRPSEGGLLADCLVRKKVDEDDFLEVRYVFARGKRNYEKNKKKER